MEINRYGRKEVRRTALTGKGLCQLCKKGYPLSQFNFTDAEGISDRRAYLYPGATAP